MSKSKILKFEPKKGPLSKKTAIKTLGTGIEYISEKQKWADKMGMHPDTMPFVNKPVSPLISDINENPLPKDKLRQGPDGRWYDPKQYRWDKKLNKFIYLDPDRFMDVKNVGNKTLGELVGSKPSVVGGTKKTIWGSLLNKAIPFGKYTSRFFGGIPMLAGELDYNKPFPFMPDYEYKPVGGEQ